MSESLVMIGCNMQKKTIKKRKRAGDTPFLISLISFLPTSSINFVLILGKVLVDYRKKCTLSLLKSPFIDVEPRFSVYERRFIDVERTFNVYERRFYLVVNTFILS